MSLSFIKWFGGFFEDIKKSASAKRAIVYIATYLLCVIVFAARDGKWESNAINAQIFWGIITIVLFGINAISREAINKVLSARIDKENQ